MEQVARPLSNSPMNILCHACDICDYMHKPSLLAVFSTLEDTLKITIYHLVLPKIKGKWGEKRELRKIIGPSLIMLQIKSNSFNLAFYHCDIY